MHELWVMAAVEVHVNATYYAQYLALTSVYGKDQSVLLWKNTLILGFFHGLLKELEWAAIISVKKIIFG